ncbi:peptide chain release factor 1 [Magnetovibrio sp. PR-2]|uniref:peptide chain release factor 1 n=1 Tax=Magnetovibrio sp. PR-2 TaxID=3120356 RepID=UPI002FCE2F06
MSLEENLKRVQDRHAELSALMSTGDLGADDFQKMSKEYADLSPIVEAITTLDKVREDLDGAESLLADAGDDVEMRELAQAEVLELKGQLPDLERQVQVLLLPKDEADDKNAILEVRAGTGGDEAALFAADLMRMYQRFAETQGWKFALMEANETGIGGYKEATAEISGKAVFAKLKFESGVHRVQRVPETESGGRIHTSAATVAVLPEAEDVDIQVRTEDLRIDTYRAQGAGGQHVNTTDSAVRIVHEPSGIVVQCQDGRSQHKNKEKAMTMLRAKLYDHQRQQIDKERADSRKGQVGSGDRSERIRTYNYPQGRITDHRINLTLHKLDRVLEGDLLELVDALTAEDQAARLAELA